MKKKQYKIDPEKRRLRMARHRAKTRMRVVEYLLDHPCVICGEADPIVLEFDHIDPLDKSEAISRMVNRNRPWDVIKDEIDKCQVMCANCHRRKTHEQRNYWSML